MLLRKSATPSRHLSLEQKKRISGEGRTIPALGALLAAFCFILLGVSATAAQDAVPTTPASSRAGLSAAGCSELFTNGGFEVTDLGWETFGAEALPAYTTSPVFSGEQAMRLGIVDGPNLAIINGIRQTVFLPNSAASIVLGFHYAPVHETAPGDDLQYLDVYDASTGQKISRLWSQLATGQQWVFLQFDLSTLKGRNLRVEFGVRNDGGGGRTSLFLDDVSLLSCDAGATPTVTPTPTPTNFSLLATPTPTSTGATASPSPTPTITPVSTSTASPTPTPLPTGCVNTGFLGNGGFEEPLGNASEWLLGKDPVPPILSGEHVEGSRSLLLGNPPGPGTPNVVSYSSVRQFITLPELASTAQISWQHQSRSQESADDSPSRWQDRQELIVLGPALDTRRILYRLRENVVAWQSDSVDLTPFLGESFYIYFNVFNDGDGKRTWMFLDDVRLVVCYPGVTPTSPTSTPTPTPTPTPTATTTLTPPTASEVGAAVETPVVVGTIVAVGVATPESSVLIAESRSTDNTPIAEESSFWQRLGRTIGRSQSIVFLLIIITVLAGVIYLRRRRP